MAQASDEFGCAIPNASGDSLMAFVGESVEPGSVVHTDGWLGYEPLESDGRHEVSYLDGQPARARNCSPAFIALSLRAGYWGIKEPSSISTPTSTRFNASPEVLFYRLVQQAVAVQCPTSRRRHRNTCYGQPQHVGAEVNTHLQWLRSR